MVIITFSCKFCDKRVSTEQRAPVLLTPPPNWAAMANTMYVCDTCFEANKIVYENAVIVRVDSIADGACFRKRTGAYAYRRISSSALSYLRLDTKKVYGISCNGNVTVMDPDRLVVPLVDAAVELQTSSDVWWNRTFSRRY